MRLDQPYNRESFIEFLEQFLPGFEKDVYEVKTNSLPEIKDARLLGIAEQFDDLHVLEIAHKRVASKRVGLANDAFKLMKQSAISKALTVFYSKEDEMWRLSLMTIQPEITKEGKVIRSYSNPHRYSYTLGPNAKVNTPTKFLLKKESITTFEDLSYCFSVEVVNKDFYKKISHLYTKLLGGERKTGSKTERFPGLLELPSTAPQSERAQRFAVRLIGRIIFCWFLREKRSKENTPLIPTELLSLEAVKSSSDYYHKTLEPLFFEILNRPAEHRRGDFQKEVFQKIPYLNGGLFAPDREDHYSYDEDQQKVNHDVVKIPDEWIRELFDVLELYNFTVDENTSVDIDLSIDPEMLGRIFENLLAEINPETGESARKNTGSYYTPREIVEYMVDQSLTEYLSTHTGIEREKLKALVSYDKLDDLEYPLSANEKKITINALSEIKVLDPACGSGAFPIGVLQKIVFMLQQIDPDAKLWFEKKIEGVKDNVLKKSIRERFESENLDYIRKIGVIRDSIFGVDIQPIATEISRLRCFLTLVVEEDVEDNKPNRGVDPLPNLDFKFVCANTLVPAPEEVENGALLGDEFQENLARAINHYFSSTGNERQVANNEIHELIDEKTDKQLRQLQGFVSYDGNEKFERARAQQNKKTIEYGTHALALWKSYKNIFKNQQVEFFDTKYFFPSVRNGFDIVIGNPPYIQLQKNSGELGTMYKEKGYKTFARTGDIYALFYERGLRLSKQNTGLLCYITSNKWMRAGYGEKLREYFASRNPLQLIDFGGFKVFESATVDTNILLIQNAEPNDGFYACHFKNNYQRGGDIDEYFNNNKILFENPTDQPWFIGSPTEISLKKKIEKIGKPLKDWDVKIYRGIVTGFNEAFIIDQKKRDELVDQDSKNEEIIKPILRGRDIKRYSYDWQGLWLIKIESGWTDKNRKIKDPEAFFQEQYPVVYRHLALFKDNKGKGKGLVNRDDQGAYWWELRDCDYYQEFEKEKVVWQEMSHEPRFTYSGTEIYTNDTCRILTGENVKFLLAIFNSNCFFSIFKNYYAGGGLGKTGIRFKNTFMENVPIPTPNGDTEKEIVDLVEQLLKSKSEKSHTKIEDKIDNLIYHLYGLTQKEIGLVKDHREIYEN